MVTAIRPAITPAKLPNLTPVHSEHSLDQRLQSLVEANLPPSPSSAPALTNASYSPRPRPGIDDSARKSQADKDIADIAAFMASLKVSLNPPSPFALLPLSSNQTTHYNTLLTPAEQPQSSTPHNPDDTPRFPQARTPVPAAPEPSPRYGAAASTRLTAPSTSDSPEAILEKFIPGCSCSFCAEFEVRAVVQ